MKTFKISPKKLVFDAKVALACKSCKHYGFKATCPPYIENMEYFRKVLPNYKHCVICYKEFEADHDNWQKVGQQSSMVIHNYLIKRRAKLLKSGHYFCTILGAGSCKLCKKCQIPCKFPGKSVVPVEGTGINVVATLKKYNFNISFPVKDKFYRIGAIFYD